MKWQKVVKLAHHSLSKLRHCHVLSDRCSVYFYKYKEKQQILQLRGEFGNVWHFCLMMTETINRLSE